MVSHTMSGHFFKYNLMNKMNAAEMQSDCMHQVYTLLEMISM